MAYRSCPSCTANNRDVDVNCYSCGGALGEFVHPDAEVVPTTMVLNLLWEGVVSGFLVGLGMALLWALGLVLLAYGVHDSLVAGLAGMILGVIAASQIFWCVFLGGCLGHLGVIGESKTAAFCGAGLTALWLFGGFHILGTALILAYGAGLGWLCYWVTARRLAGRVI